MNDVRLYIEEKEFTAEDGATVSFNQVMLEVAGVPVAIKPVFKDEKRLLVALASRKE